MNKYSLTQEEQDILEAFDGGEFESVDNVEEFKRKIILAAKNSSAKNKTINIRLSPKSLHDLKVKAAQEGIPYQTLAASILHKYANNNLLSK